ncbi:MAG: protein phosphatase CheZ [Marivibrio sp.]|uniref:protein phosphatase CheZ n=1 Tax=Marivibrio sp. TaxID=2039719 RepID=UPI0032EBCEE0
MTNLTASSSAGRSQARRPFRAERAGLDVGAAGPLAPEPPLPRPPQAADRDGAEAASGAPSSGASFAAGDELAAIHAELAEMKTMLAALQPAGAPAGEPAGLGAQDVDSDLAVRVEIARMVKMIGRAKTELSLIKHPNADNNRIEEARNELDAIVTDTGAATEEILARAEEQMDLVTKLAGLLDGDAEQEALAAQIEEAAIKIMEACNFQDLTGQRTSKVITTLRHIEERIVAMIGIWGIEAFEDLPVPEEEAEGDAALLNGPARSGEGISQADIDALFD